MGTILRFDCYLLCLKWILLSFKTGAKRVMKGAPLGNVIVILFKINHIVVEHLGILNCM